MITLIASFSLAGYSRAGADHNNSKAVISVESFPVIKITKTDFKRSFRRSVLVNGYKKAPKNKTALKEIKTRAIDDLLDQAWLKGEGRERGIVVKKEEIKKQFKKTLKIQFQGKKRLYKKFLKTSGFNHQEVIERIKLMVISEKIEKEVFKDVSSKDFVQTYRDFIDQYNQKWASRTVCQPGYSTNYFEFKNKAFVSRCSNLSN